MALLPASACSELGQGCPTTTLPPPPPAYHCRPGRGLTRCRDQQGCTGMLWARAMLSPQGEEEAPQTPDQLAECSYVELSTALPHRMYAGERAMSTWE